MEKLAILPHTFLCLIKGLMQRLRSCLGSGWRDVSMLLGFPAPTLASQFRVAQLPRLLTGHKAQFREPMELPLG